MKLWNKYRNSYASYFLMYAFYYMSWALFSALISVYLMDLGFSATSVSIVVSAGYLVSMILQPMIGRLSLRVDPCKINICLAVIGIFGGMVFASMKSFLGIVIGYSSVLALINGINPVMEKMATGSPFRYGSIRIWGTIGYACGSQVAGLIYDYISPTAVYSAFCISMVLTVIGMAGAKPKMEEGKQETEKSRSLFTNRKFLYYLMISGIFNGVTMMGHTYIPSMFVADGMDVSLTSTLLCFAVFCELPFVLFSNRFMDKIPNKVLLMTVYVMVVLQYMSYACGMSMPIRIILTMIAKHPAGMMMIMINLKVVHSIVEARQVIEALSIVATVKNLTCIIAQSVAGSLLDVMSYSQVFLVFTVVMAAGLVLTVLFRVPSGNEHRLFS